MDLLSMIRRWHLRDHLSLHEIARRSGLSRNTIKKYLRGDIVEPRYPKRQGKSQLDPYREQLIRWLTTEANKHRKQRRCAKQLYRDLVSLGYCGSYDRVCVFVRHWRAQQHAKQQTAQRGTFIPLRFAPGEAFQFDWSEDFAVIAGERVKLQIAHFKLCYSRAFYLRAYWQQKHEMLYDSHNQAFRVFDGVAMRGIYDNMKTAVDKIAVGKARTINSRFKALASHYLFEPTFCNPASGWEKGRIEKSVRDARTRVWQQAPTFASLADLNDWLEQCCLADWQTMAHPDWPERRIAQVWAEERPYLMRYERPFDGYVDINKHVSPLCLVTFERNRYSVPSSYANRLVTLRIYCDRLVIVADGNVIAEHAREMNRRHEGGQTVFDWRHYLAVLDRKPGALRNGAPFAELPKPFVQLQALLTKRPGGDREMVDVLGLVLHHNEDAVLMAVELALEAGVPTKTHIVNLLHRLLDPSPPPPVNLPPAWQLTVEPLANVSRYDVLYSHTERRHEH